MSEPLLIGTLGWDDTTWAGSFYPEELPVEWRFCFYSNRLRSVLLPATTTASATRPQATAWREDSDAQFRWVLQLPPDFAAATDVDAALSDLRTRFEPIEAQIAGFLWAPSRSEGGSPARWMDHIPALQTYRPLCVDLSSAPPTDTAAVAILESNGVAHCWYPDREPSPLTSGDFLVAIAPAADARTLRGWIQTLAAWRGEQRRAALFFQGADAARAASEARIIAELLSV